VEEERGKGVKEERGKGVEEERGKGMGGRIGEWREIGRRLGRRQEGSMKGMCVERKKVRGMESY
jgi:hypothetical protein